MKELKTRILASVLAVVMMLASIPVTGSTVTAAENSAFILGADYIITSKSSGKVLTVEGNSKEEGAKIIQTTANDSDFQIWTVTDGGDGYYNLVNKVSGKAIDVPNSSKKAGVELKQYNNGSNRNYQKFAITDTGDGYYRITPKQVSNFAIRVKDDSKADGATIVQAESTGDDCEKWSFQLVKADYAISDYEAVARQAFDSWVDKFYYVEDNKYGRLSNNNGYWTEFEILEMFVDAYEHFGDKKYLDLAEQLYEGLIDKDDTNWQWNGYTDDTMYMTIATIRLYMVSNNSRQLNIAKRNFDLVYERAVQDDGAMIWCTDKDKQIKNACANCPTMIAAVYMGKATGDKSYFDKAERIWEWTYPNLFEKQYEKSGGYDDSGIQGIFIGSSALLYSVTGKQKYKDVALRACEIAKTLGEGANEILNGEGVKNGDYNSVAAKGILARWLGYCLELFPEVTQYDYWMEINADSAWHYRNSDNLMWGHFGTQTMEKVEECEDYYESQDHVQKKQYAAWACSAAVSWLINCTGLPVVGKEVENANKIEAENAALSGGAAVENDSKCSNGKNVGNIGTRDGSAQFVFESDDDGKALLSLYYAGNEAGKYNVTINGKDTYTVDCPLANAPACLSVDFVKGDNTVVVSGVVDNASPNLDYVGVNLPDHVEMEDGYRKNGARTGKDESYSGGKDLEWVGGEKGGSVAFMIPAEADGKAALSFPYATNGNRKVKVIVNGKENNIDCKSTKSWDVFSTEPLTVDINLQKGVNEIIFTGVEKESAPNLDWFKIEWMYNQAKIADKDSIIVYDPDAEQKEADQKAADTVIHALESIREADITLEDAESIAKLRDAYDALTQEQKNLIPDEQLKILTRAETKLKELQEAADKETEGKEPIETEGKETEDKESAANQKAADEVIEAISKIGTVTLESETSIAAARAAYDKLSDVQKKLVTNYKDLETAETEIAKQKADKGTVRPSTVSKGDVYTYKNVKYKVTKADMTGKGTVGVVGLKKTKKTVTIPSAVKVQGVTFKVTSICKNAFSGCGKLKTIKIKTKNLKSVGKNAFKGIHKKARIKVPSSKLKKYKSLLKKKGQSKSVKITK